MSIGITAWLWILAAAVIPLLIHLWSRKSGQPKMLPTFRFLPEKSIARASRIELHEKLLLLLRIALITLIAFLLAGLFFDRPQRTAQTVKLTEHETESSEEWGGDDILEIIISSQQIDRLGWWHLLEQVDYEYRPNLIITEGRLTSDRFTGELPELSAELEWNPIELPAEIQSATWNGADDRKFEYVQQRTDGFVDNRIVPLSEGVDSLAGGSSLRVLISSDTDSNFKSGFETAAELWNIELTEADLPSGQLADIRFDDREIRLFSESSAAQVQMQLSPGPQFGVEIPVMVSDSIHAENDQMRRFDGNRKSVVFEKGQNEFVLQSTPDAAYAHWFYAGVGHQLLKEAAGIDDMHYPEVSDDKRQPIRIEEPARAGVGRKEPATNILLLCLLLVWAAERILSNRRGM